MAGSPSVQHGYPVRNERCLCDRGPIFNCTVGFIADNGRMSDQRMSMTLYPMIGPGPVARILNIPHHLQAAFDDRARFDVAVESYAAMELVVGALRGISFDLELETPSRFGL